MAWYGDFEPSRLVAFSRSGDVSNTSQIILIPDGRYRTGISDHPPQDRSRLSGVRIPTRWPQESQEVPSFLRGASDSGIYTGSHDVRMKVPVRRWRPR